MGHEESLILVLMSHVGNHQNMLNLLDILSKHTYVQTDIQTNKNTKRQETDRRKNRQTDVQTNRQKDRHADRLEDI